MTRGLIVSKKLTAKQEELLARITTPLRVETALAFIRGGYENQTEAYLLACKKLGKKPAKVPSTSASEILSFPEVAAFIDSVKYEAAQTVNIDAAWVLSASKKLYDKCMEAEPLTDSDGNEVGMAKFHPAGAAKAIELIGKHVDIRAFELEAANTDSKPININIVNPHANSPD